jgi:hypothetical protein
MWTDRGSDQYAWIEHNPHALATRACTSCRAQLRVGEIERLVIPHVATRSELPKKIAQRLAACLAR